ncbi:energy transducer TonB family protein [Solilutibacter silvestris]|uniref:energy transducer TonB family protein n=1 Tax=Solilutibacter silvestris TaxID=1645665 RepID=UPI003D326C7A
MTETIAPHNYRHDDDAAVGLNWPRIAGMSAALAVHVAALLLLMAPVSPPQGDADKTERVAVQLIKPPPPPPPPPPKEIVPPPPAPNLPPQPPRPSPPVPPTPQPPIVSDTANAVSYQAPPPAPPAPPAPPPPPAPPAPSGPKVNNNDLRGNLCGQPSQTPLQIAINKASAKGFSGGTARISVTYTAEGGVTATSVSGSSGDRDLDRAAASWARGVKICAGAAGTGTLPIVLNVGE